MVFFLDGNEIQLESEGTGIRLRTNAAVNQLLANVTMDEVKEVVTQNYGIVKAHYAQIVSERISGRDLEKVALQIVLHYFYMYQLWRSLYPAERDRDLTFREEDFGHPGTSDQIMFYFKAAYPKDYAGKCEAMLGMSAAQFRQYEKARQAFFDR